MWFSTGCSAKFFVSFFLAVFVLVCHFCEESGEECVNDGADEYDSGYEVKSILFEGTVFKCFD